MLRTNVGTDSPEPAFDTAVEPSVSDSAEQLGVPGAKRRRESSSKSSALTEPLSLGSSAATRELIRMGAQCVRRPAVNTSIGTGGSDMEHCVGVRPVGVKVVSASQT